MAMYYIYIPTDKPQAESGGRKYKLYLPHTCSGYDLRFMQFMATLLGGYVV